MIALDPPAAETTVAVVLGASEYPQWPGWSNPVLGASARAIRDYLQSPDGLAMKPGQILDLFDAAGGPADQLFKVEAFLKTLGAAAHDLIVYYVGHGSFDHEDYCLGIRETQPGREFLSAIESKKLARIIREGFARKRVYVILDSCFAASAASDFQATPIDHAVQKMWQRLPQHGTAFLAAASKADVTRAPRHARYTVFTGAVLDALAVGVEVVQPRISLYELYELVRDRLARGMIDEEARPEIHNPSQRDGDVSRLALFPNPAYQRLLEAARAQAEASPHMRVEANREPTEAAARLQAAEQAAPGGFGDTRPDAGRRDPPPPEDELGRRFRFSRSLIGLVIGGCVGLWFPSSINLWLWEQRYWFPIIIQILLAPLIIAAVIRGVASGTGNPISLRTIGWFISKVLVWFAFSTVAALAIGLAIAWVAPDAAVSCPQGIPKQKQDQGTPRQEQDQGATTDLAAPSPLSAPSPPHDQSQEQVADRLQRGREVRRQPADQTTDQKPREDPRSAEAHITNWLPWIFFLSAVLGFFLPLTGSKGAPIKQLIDSLEVLSSKMAGFVPYVVPFAAGAGLAAQIGKYGVDNLWPMLWCIGLLYGALLTYIALLLVAMKVLARARLRTFLSALFKPAVIASVTRTSGAAMPFTIPALERLGIPPDIVGFVVPTGSLFNLAGSALYVMFGIMISNRCGGAVPITIGLFFDLMLKSMTIAGVPGGALGVLRGYNPSLVGWLEVCDFVMDMGRTCVNVIGNSVATVIIASWEHKIPPNAPIRSSGSGPGLLTTRRHR